MMLLFRFGAKRKILPLLFVPSVIHQYKPKIKKFWHLNKNARSFLYKDLKNGIRQLLLVASLQTDLHVLITATG